MENRISAIVFGIPAVKGIEFGNGFACADLRGSQNNDAITVRDGKICTKTNNCGGILGGSLYDASMSREELFASVGDTVAHEISHAFDTTGAQFDEKGNLRNWWTEEDQKAFAQRADKLVAYFDNIEPFQDVNCVGSQIEGEAIADLVGFKCVLRIAAGQEDFDYKRFFESYAETWHSISTSETEYYLITQDSHPLAYLRINAVVQQFEPFFETYDVQPGDGMYLAPDKRIVMWGPNA
jgi:putative endopeptidase